MFLVICSVSYGQSSRKSYPEADAVYLNLTRTYVLNKDGSMTSAVDIRSQAVSPESIFVADVPAGKIAAVGGISCANAASGAGTSMQNNIAGTNFFVLPFTIESSPR